jgi:hypothetical protein
VASTVGSGADWHAANVRANATKSNPTTINIFPFIIILLKNVFTKGSPLDNLNSTGVRFSPPFIAVNVPKGILILWAILIRYPTGIGAIIHQK